MITVLLLLGLGLLAAITRLLVDIREGIADIAFHPLGGQVPYPAPGDDSEGER